MTYWEEEAYSEGVTLTHGDISIDICKTNNQVFVYEKKRGEWVGINYRFNFDEIKMINKVIEGMEK